ncbi:MAG: SHOCT domain-containing protein [Nitrospirales bacterium]
MPPMLFAIIIGCETISYSSGLSSTRYLVNEPEMTVGMEVTYRDGSPEYSHPAAINPELLDQVLHHIEVQPSSLLERIAGGSATIQQAFSAEQRSVLCNALSKALNLATSLETVTFYWATPRGNGLWEITSGGLYLQEDDLHMLLTNYRQTVPAKNPPQNPRKHPLSPLGESLHSLRAIDPLRQLSHSLATELWSPQTPHFIFPLKTWSTGQNPSHSPEVSASHTSGGSRESIKQRLKNLEDLRKEGLLTEKEYQQKRQEIFEEL